MTAAAKEKREVTLPEGVSLRRVAEVLRDAWEADPRRWMDASTLHSSPATEDGPPQLREGAPPKPAMPVPQDAMDLFRLLAERRVDYLLVGGLAMLTYIKGRNTKDVDLLMSVAALEKLPELRIEDRNDLFARGKFRSIQVDLLLTKNPLFKIVAEKFATRHPFAELEVPAVTVEGLVVLKLYALPSLYRQFDMDRAAVYENDITMLIARHSPAVEPLTALASQYAEPGDKKELQKIISECCERAVKLRQRTTS
ncbi:MAG: hypothetical protein ABSA45_09375 [Verrucomicrobiota bacterium]|jgi:hypothetical protein